MEWSSLKLLPHIHGYLFIFATTEIYAIFTWSLFGLRRENEKIFIFSHLARVSYLLFSVEKGFQSKFFARNSCNNCAKISSKCRTKFQCFCALMCKNYFAQILRKILIFVYFVISCYFLILSFFFISLDFKKQFQEINSKFNQSESTILQPARRSHMLAK